MTELKRLVFLLCIIAICEGGIWRSRLHPKQQRPTKEVLRYEIRWSVAATMVTVLLAVVGAYSDEKILQLSLYMMVAIFFMENATTVQQTFSLVRKRLEQET